MKSMTETELQEILTSRLSLKSPRFELERLPNGKLSGSVVSNSFQGKGDSDRQREIWDALEKELGAKCTSLVGTLLAYTDAEWNVDLAER